MKLTLCFILAVAGVMTAEEVKKQPPAKTETEIPAGATEVSSGVFRHVDKDGKAWLYRRSPFGLLKTEDTGDRPAKKEPPAESLADGMTAVEEGDSIRFSRRSPFGRNEWVRKKSELTADEKGLWERQQARKAPAKQ